MKSKPIPGVIHTIIGCIILFFALIMVFVMNNSKMGLFLLVGIGFIVFGIYRKSKEKHEVKPPQHVVQTHTDSHKQVQHSQHANQTNQHIQHATHKDIHHQPQHPQHHTSEHSTHNAIHNPQNYFQNNYHGCQYCGSAVNHKDQFCSSCGKRQY